MHTELFKDIVDSYDPNDADLRLVNDTCNIQRELLIQEKQNDVRITSLTTLIQALS